MSALIEELRQHALMIANEIKRNEKDHERLAEVAYERVKTFDGKVCPQCWVNNGLKSKINIVASANETNSYKCEACSFEGIFPKD
jgi:hypothetical protein